ncbi:MAG: hypothetical protein ATN36_07205 [Epulopiscium sp. Nele67-Bin005]|nr:MAG: hypothetical protein ATN36_07205 [Epulopiscium sp. Nele67-Bin005]
MISMLEDIFPYDRGDTPLPPGNIALESTIGTESPMIPISSIREDSAFSPLLMATGVIDASGIGDSYLFFPSEVMFINASNHDDAYSAIAEYSLPTLEVELDTKTELLFNYLQEFFEPSREREISIGVSNRIDLPALSNVRILELTNGYVKVEAIDGYSYISIVPLRVISGIKF